MTSFKTIVGAVNKIPIRALTLYDTTVDPTDFTHIFNIESNSNWELKERVRSHSRRISTVIGYSFSGEFSVPYNDFYNSGLLDKLNHAMIKNPAVFTSELYEYLGSKQILVITVGDALPPNIFTEDDIPSIENATDGYWIFLRHFALSYSIKTAEFRHYLSINIRAEMKVRGGESPLVYDKGTAIKLFMRGNQGG